MKIALITALLLGAGSFYAAAETAANNDEPTGEYQQTAEVKPLPNFPAYKRMEQNRTIEDNQRYLKTIKPQAPEPKVRMEAG